jgi:hypothetical protein
MLTAEKPSLWRGRYDITIEGGRIAEWEPSWWRSGGVFDLNGERYQIRGSALGSRFQLIGPAGHPIASAQRVGRRRWTVHAGDRIYQFRRLSMWRGDQELLLGDQAVGSIRRTSMWRNSAVADLPGMPEPVQVFVLCVVLAKWNAQTAEAAAAGAASPH